MKLYATIQNEAGKIASKAGNESLMIALTRGNRRMVELFFTVEALTDDKELLVIDMLNLSDGSTTRLLEREDNSNLPEYRTK